MHYTIDYSKIKDPVIKQAQAIQDIKEYLGAARFKKICKIVHADQTMGRKMFIDSLSMLVGIDGYPAEAWADELGLVVTTPEEVKTSL